MTAMQRRAVDLLCSNPVEQVAEMLEVKARTIRGWMKQPEFAAELRNRDKETAESLARISNHAAMLAAIRFSEAASSGKLDPKTLFETLKLCAAFESPTQESDMLAEVVGRICSDDDD